ncbi:MAG: RHS repeat domain-containing protein, partial [Methanosarcinaceae archaeon]
YQLDHGQPLAAVGAESTSFYLYGRGVIGTKTNDWGYILQDGLGSTRQLATHEGEVVMSVAYTPWGDVLEYYGSGGIDFGYLGGKYDDTTGLIYMGGGQYYDPVTGRFLTRGAGSNPYKPGAFDPAGMMIAPLALIGLVLGKKKKRGKWDSFIAVLAVCVVVGMSVSACNQPSGAPAPIASGTPTPLQTPTITLTGTPRQTPEGDTVYGKYTSTPGASYQDLRFTATIHCNKTPTPMPTPSLPEVSSDARIVKETYLKLWHFRYEDGSKPWWWYEGHNMDESFTPLDFLDRLLQFEFASIMHLASDYDKDTFVRTGVGSFCFWMSNPGDDCRAKINDSGEIFEYIAKRKLLKIVQKTEKTEYSQGYSIPGDNYDPWTRKEDNARGGYELPFVERFNNPDDYLLDVWNLDFPKSENDVPVEWGNDIAGHQDDFYDNKDKNCFPDGPGCIEGEKTNNVLYNEGNFYIFTYCQWIFYNSGFDPVFCTLRNNCSNGDHWSQ